MYYNCDNNGDKTCDYNCVGGLSSNANLKSLTVDSYVLKPLFDENITAYTVSVPAETLTVNLAAVPVNSKAKVSGPGVITIPESEQGVTVPVQVIAEDGVTTKTYLVTIVKEIKPPVVGNGSSNVEFTTSENGSLTVSYINGISAENVFPGWTGTQKFTIKNTTNKTIVYSINLIDVVNTFETDNFKYTLKADGVVVKDPSGNPIELVPALKKDGVVAQNLVITAGSEVTYTIDYLFEYLDRPQNEDQGRAYKSKIEIRMVSMN